MRRNTRRSAEQVGGSISGLTAVDLFAGAGGATQGLVAAGFRVLAAVENDPAAARTYAANHPLVRLCTKDIRLADPAELLGDLRLRPGQLTVLKSCPPCQAFSTLGNRRPTDRDDLVLEVWRFVSELRPKCVMLENVPGLRHDVRLHMLIRRCRAIGYGFRHYVVDASEFGVPQRRRRLIVIGALGVSRNRFPDSLLDALPPSFDRSRRTAGDALAAILATDQTPDPIHRHRRLKPRTLARIRHIPVGGDRFDLPERYRLKCHKHLQKRNATASYGRLRVDEPAPTMTSRCTTPACGRFIHPTENRGLSLREAALLQTFPRWYHFEGGYGQVERQIGNALPVKLAEALGLVAARVVMPNRWMK